MQLDTCMVHMQLDTRIHEVGYMQLDTCIHAVGYLYTCSWILVYTQLNTCIHAVEYLYLQLGVNMFYIVIAAKLVYNN